MSGHDDYHVFGDGELTPDVHDPTGGSELLDRHVAVPLLTVWDNDGHSSNGAGCVEDVEFVTSARMDVVLLLAEVRRARRLVRDLAAR